MSDKKADNLEVPKSAEKSIKVSVESRKQAAEHKAALYASALANGLVPKTEDPALMDALSLLGNQAFERSLIYHGEREAKLRAVAEQNEFSGDSMLAIVSELDKQPTMPESRFSGLTVPSTGFTAPLTFGTEESLSALAPSDFGPIADRAPGVAPR